jgi:SAM-dependent methyltransferase
MEFYEDILRARAFTAEDLPLGAHFHTWTPETIARLWSIWASNPILRRQYYPPEYYETLLAEASPHLDETGVVVDIGCGSGTVLSLLRQKKMARRLIGVDVSESALAALRVRLAGDPAFTFQLGSIAATGLDDGSCDLVVCTETIEHLFPPDFTAGLAEIGRVLKSGGRLLATVPIEERPNFVVCPECHAIFAPYQHMLFNFTISGLREALGRHQLEIVHVIQPIDTGIPRRAWKRLVKDRILRPFFPGLTRRLFRVAGVSGLVARKRGEPCRG